MNTGAERVAELIVGLAALGICAVLTDVVRSVATAHGLLDIPNARSSHAVPTPRGGGVAIVIASTAAFLTLWLMGLLDGVVFVALLGGLPVAVVGLIDDRRPLPASVRLAVHVGAACWATAWLGGFGAGGTEPWPTFAAGFIVRVMAIAWAVNLFNFMDGIDGLAASEACMVGLGGALLGFIGRGGHLLTGASLAFGLACMGFLRRNWPPAKIFMGDVGSGYLGFVIAVLALASGREDPSGPWAWLILGGAFVVDATVTLLRRLLRGERVYQAHRTHAYQRLARRWNSHGRVTLGLVVLDVAWLLPAAVAASLLGARAPWVALGALAPIGLLAVLSGAGRREQPAATHATGAAG